MSEVLIVAGEASADLHASRVVRELRARRPALRFAGIGGERLRGEGVELIEHAERLAVMGFLEVLRHVPAQCPICSWAMSKARAQREARAQRRP